MRTLIHTISFGILFSGLTASYYIHKEGSKGPLSLTQKIQEVDVVSEVIEAKSYIDDNANKIDDRIERYIDIMTDDDNSRLVNRVAARMIQDFYSEGDTTEEESDIFAQNVANFYDCFSLGQMMPFSLEINPAIIHEMYTRFTFNETKFQQHVTNIHSLNDPDAVELEIIHGYPYFGYSAGYDCSTPVEMLRKEGGEE